MAKPKVLISDDLSPQAVEIFKNRGIDVDYKPGMKADELLSVIGNYDGLAVRSATKVTAKVIEAAKRLKVVGRAGIGVDNIDVPKATAGGIIVMNTPFGNSITTAEHAIAMMFALARDLPAANASTQAGKWEKNRFMGVELFAKTLGVIGCGNIGSIVADRALGLKMKVVAYDPYLTPERAKQLGVEKVELDDLLKRADFITLHVPLTDSTRGIVSAANIAKMKKGVRIINCARGELIVEADVKAALDSGQIGGLALDVFPVEPAKESVFFGDERVVATPHLGASTNEAQENVAIQVAEQISDFLLSGAVVNALNMPSVSAEDAPKLMPYMALSEQLGSLIGQLIRTGIKSVTIDYDGHVAELNTRPLTAVILKGLLSPQTETVNMVNAPVIARERDIAVAEAKHERASDYQSLIRLTVETENSKRTVAGTLFGGDKPRLVEVNGISIEAELGSNMLYVTNQDKPGFIGNLGRTLAEANANIATFHLGRTSSGGDAVALIKIDSPVTDAIVEKVKAIPNVVQVQALNF
ncbi:MAG: phosphoglycerate dehydrogenase [Alphaproteobacteria bacterium]